MRAAVLDGTALQTWLGGCVHALEERCEQINALNVFPIPDSDTGTNLVFTVRAAYESVVALAPGGDVGHVATVMARGAVAGARGNSGVIVSQLLRGVAESVATVGHGHGRMLANGLHRGSELAAAAMSRPVEGTVLTVLHCAADGAQSAVAAGQADDVVAVARAASMSARAALSRTPAQLDVLARAGVVDAGGFGAVVMLDALVSALTGTPAPDAPVAAASVVASGSHESGDFYEVMFSITETTADRMRTVRDRLDRLGESVALVSDGDGSWSVHVHTTDAGGAVEAALTGGRVHGIRIERISSPPVARAVIAVVGGPGAVRLFTCEGAVTVPPRDVDAGLLEALRRSGSPESIVLPNGYLTAEAAVAVSAAARAMGVRVHLVPTSSVVQGLAALAVHDATRDGDDDAFAMAAAASATRWGSLRIAWERSLTQVGTCQRGDALGLVGQDVVVIDPDPMIAGGALLDRVLDVGGELVTLIAGAGAESVVTALTEHVEVVHPGVEVCVYDGGRTDELVQWGVE